jgi:hypothetical protein
MIMETGASAKWTHTFESEHEMFAVLSPILARQKRRTGVPLMPDKVRLGGQYFFDLDLTQKEAEFLGWNNT